MSIDLQELLHRYPQPDHNRVMSLYEDALSQDSTKIIAFDDDPTGVQTVHDVFVYTDWKPDTFREAFRDGRKISFVLTNSRGLTAEQSEQLHREAALALCEAGMESGTGFLILSRGDSTLRGHYPLETETIRQVQETVTGHPVDGEILMPYFLEGGRYTAEDIHYVAYGDRLVPCGETEFAGDKTFGYASSSLPKWIEEKTDGKVPASEVLSITLEELRELRIDSIVSKLCSLKHFQKVVVNALCDDDVRVFAVGVFRALAAGKTFICRSAAALAKALGGVPDRELLSRAELIDPNNRNGGLIIVGSHVSKTTAQLNKLLEDPGVTAIELNQHLVVDEEKFRREVDRVISCAQEQILQGHTCVCYTRRERFDLNTGCREDELRLAVRISDAVTSIASSLTVRPNFIIAKGGITSSEIGTKALACRKARVMGQILKGIPVWETGPESRFPHMPYVIFPGNVGTEDDLKLAVEKMSVN